MRARKFVTIAGALVLPVALAATMGAGIASAKGKPPAAQLSGVATCATHNGFTLSFSSPLTSTPADVTVTVNPVLLKGCTYAPVPASAPNNGHLTGLGSAKVTGATCAGFLGGATAPDLTGGRAKWTPKPKFASSAVSLTNGTMSVNGAGDIALSYSSGTVTGSFAGTASLSVTSSMLATDLNAECANGLTSIAFTGSASL